MTPEAPTLTLAHGTLTVPEDGAVALGISETPVNANDTVTVTISGIPSDATLSDTNGDTLTITDGSITLTPAGACRADAAGRRHQRYADGDGDQCGGDVSAADHYAECDA